MLINVLTHLLIPTKTEPTMPQEYILPDDIVILSRSDLQGNIVAYNE